FVVGKRHFLALRASIPRPDWFFVDANGRFQPYWLLVIFLLSSLLLSWLFMSASGRRLKISYRSALLAIALTGMLGLVTELWLRF
ncbi:MAG: hypothetical protein ACRD4K_03600, partial [Candidatus Acidiferrales bacterium]